MSCWNRWRHAWKKGKTPPQADMTNPGMGQVCLMTWGGEGGGIEVRKAGDGQVLLMTW